jgi:hypothetical protein
MDHPKIFDYYVLVFAPTHPRAISNGYVPEQFIVAEEALGRPLTPDEDVRHVNDDAQDNRPENLEIISINSDYKVQSFMDSYSLSKRSSSRTYIPCKYQQPCWREVRAPMARKLKTYLPYICSFQSEGDVYQCSRFWGFKERDTEVKEEIEG